MERNCVSAKQRCRLCRSAVTAYCRLRGVLRVFFGQWRVFTPINSGHWRVFLGAVENVRADGRARLHVENVRADGRSRLHVENARADDRSRNFAKNTPLIGVMVRKITPRNRQCAYT